MSIGKVHVSLLPITLAWGVGSVWAATAWHEDFEGATLGDQPTAWEVGASERATVAVAAAPDGEGQCVHLRDTTPHASAHIARTFPPSRCGSVSFRVRYRPGESEHRYVNIRLGNAEHETLFVLWVYRDGMWRYWAGAGDTPLPVPGHRPETWYPVTIAWDGIIGRFSVQVGDTDPVIGLPATAEFGAVESFRVGTQGTVHASQIEAWVDEVSIDDTPPGGVRVYHRGRPADRMTVRAPEGESARATVQVWSAGQARITTGEGVACQPERVPCDTLTPVRLEIRTGRPTTSFTVAGDAGTAELSVSVINRGATVSVLPGEWPMLRRDPANSGRSPLPMRPGEPHVLWRVPTGGRLSSNNACNALWSEADGLLLTGVTGSVVALDRRGTARWRRALPHGVRDLLAVRDLDDDGVREVVAFTNRSEVVVLRAADGTILWQRAFKEISRHTTRLADVDRDGRPELLVVPGYDPMGMYCFTFADGASRPRELWRFPMGDNFRTGYRPVVTVGDVDADGRAEVTLATKWQQQRVLILDGTTGRLKGMAEFPFGTRNYGSSCLADLDGDGLAEVVVAAYQSDPHHLTVVGKIGDEWTVHWNHNLTSLRPARRMVGDVDGDGQVEVFATVLEGNATSRSGSGLGTGGLGLRPRVVVWDGTSGDEKLSLPGKELEDVLDRGSDGAAVLLLTDGSGRELVLWHAGREHSLGGGRWLADPVPEWGGHEASTLSQAGHGVAQATWQGRQVAFVVTADATGRIAQAVDSSGERVWSARAEAEFDLLVAQARWDADGGEQKPVLIFGMNDGTTRAFDEGGAELTRWWSGGRLSTPQVARLRPDGPAMLFTTHSGGSVAVHGLYGAQPKLLWRVPGVGQIDGALAYARSRDDGVVVWDVDGDGAREVLAFDSISHELRCWDSDGGLKWRRALPTEYASWTVGRFGDEVVVVVSLHPGNFYATATWLLRGRDGAVKWKTNFGAMYGYPAIGDLNDDGIDDIVAQEFFTVRRLDGAGGTELWPSIQLPGYHTPQIEYVQGDLALLMGGGYASLALVDPAGRVLWRHADLFYDTYNRRPGVADMDGDGELEVAYIRTREGALLCARANTGEELWRHPLTLTPSDITTVDLGADGRSDLLFGGSDGRLYAVDGARDAPQRVLWTRDFGATVGTPIVADTNGDGKGEIVVPVADGHVYCLGQ